MSSLGGEIDRIALRSSEFNAINNALNAGSELSDLANEVLLDGEAWPGGEAVVAASPPPLPDGRVAVRLFGLLVPADGV
ncbi:hypothetical protein E1293_20050 [Actinomadura darangshiensis]|uniref:Uncharacterized protein n=1 Tax=Actinomadura darangshiensis TaxID=705336 RepID=A0A4V2YV97_9ACTN|nr:hypothetical protein [Actinomadura darangshiensis]TDD80737.1 hypothetical protein E1293_20050 [Actinomadura darangshiensis]